VFLTLKINSFLSTLYTFFLILARVYYTSPRLRPQLVALELRGEENSHERNTDENFVQKNVLRKASFGEGMFAFLVL
jgi:hypothetical protein